MTAAYSDNSAAQNAGGKKTADIVAKCARIICKMNPEKTTFTIAEHGCATGANSLAQVQAFVNISTPRDNNDDTKNLTCSTEISSWKGKNSNLYLLNDNAIEGIAPSHQCRYFGKAVHEDKQKTQYENEFYEKVKSIHTNGCDDYALGHLTEFMIEFVGLRRVRLPHSFCNKSRPVVGELLVLRNLSHGYQNFRMVDLKIGYKTAQRGWRGKSASRAFSQSVTDLKSNSSLEGFRLEAFIGRSRSLVSVDKLMEPGADSVKSIGPYHLVYRRARARHEVRKKNQNLVLNGRNMSGKEIFLHYTALSDRGGSINTHLSSIECAEIIHHETTSRIWSLLQICQRIKTPQKWVGTSLGLGFDAGLNPERTAAGKDELRRSVFVKLFDWERAELTFAVDFSRMTKRERLSRIRAWDAYKRSLKSLYVQSVEAYRCQFGNDNGWGKFYIRVFHYDHKSKDQFIGEASIPMRNTEGTRICRLVDAKGHVIGETSYRLVYHVLPGGSRLEGSWHLNLGEASLMKGRARNLYCVIAAVTRNGDLAHQLVSQVKKSTSKPTWNETFHIPVALSTRFVDEATPRLDLLQREENGLVDEYKSSFVRGLGMGHIFYVCNFLFRNDFPAVRK
eukprot:CAMPEP_0194275206 /NCGR_PEP_ID=MMETSP0169-20130528/8106_1 /TAXON_ID=218684 /ORGANISM="Corethron pennatum, Strain L29A3" /LENGTH=618 /DNA_ID=CAMNT_0039018617 /DNA_START=123 /DNA_END=1979 /DNA_ORIENTATION=+